MANSGSTPNPLVQSQQLPCDGDGYCMLCKKKPSEGEKLVCKTCVTPWHVECLSSPPLSMSLAASWECPDCAPAEDAAVVSIVSAVVAGPAGELLAKIREIEADATLSEPEKAKKRQQLLGGLGSGETDDGKMKDDNEIMNILGENIKCSFCMQLPERPVTTSCGHNFCLKCFEKWWGQGKRTCAKCRVTLPEVPPRINSSLVFAIRMARISKPAAAVVPRVFQFVHNDDLPDEAFTTERAKKAGKANAKSGRIFVTIPNDFLGPIPPEYDPSRNMGVLVGDCWADRLACRQWGAHFPHVSGIAGQAKYGAQSVVLSGGYLDDEDHGEWFLYTGSGGRDLSGNKRTSKYQTHDQKFTGGNEALRLSCRKGYPVRVVRSFKEKRSNYAPEIGVRYDGIYRIEKCWANYATEEVNKQLVKSPYLVCRYLFVRCDNSPAPWTSDEHGDRPRPLPNVPELKGAKQLTVRKESPHWDYDADEGCWKWKMPAPSSKLIKKGTESGRSKKRSKANILKEFSCLICRKVLTLPVTTPCAHNFCKSCLDATFEGQKFERERKSGGRSLRTQKTVMKCPSCTTDISEFLQNAQVNRELMGVIESLMLKFSQEKADSEESSGALNENESESEDADISTSDIEGDEIKSVEEEPDMAMEEPHGENGNVDGEGACEIPDEVKIEPSAAKKRGRPKKSNVANGAAAKTRGRKSRRVAEDGNDSPSSPLHVRSDNELE
ncbi:E3 ubiquitin-protein ligase ORTHRUS 2-like [Chenopodium quinoa]|uniref:E3 ubiquitin-protein ligase ORTHRUS 2-like n=1 Tax=Chenopodium quinoa TaxID=63459 RepID=UPI000B78EBD9|nr:E3 ubiquitin-protein ligase ORTHRUS 2-like [Chenopodium quinoa]